jgi:hypothetical protein
MPLVPGMIVGVLARAPFDFSNFVEAGPEPRSVTGRLISSGAFTVKVPAASITTCPAGAPLKAAWIAPESSRPLGEIVL